MTELSTQQQEAIEKIREWHYTANIDPFRLFGPAGTGKTTLAREVPAALGLTAVEYGAFTGKAASVLRGKGCTPAGTLHSLIYKPMVNAETAAKLRAARDELEDMEADATSGDPTACGWASRLELAGAMDEVRETIAALEKEAKTIGWEWNPESVLAEAELLILDEVSMVDAKLASDIERFEVPVLVLGDPEQLEPVGGEGYYINAAPDYALTEIHRQALESPVLELATRVRTSADTRLGLTPDDTEPRSLARAMEHDQIICWKNATRWLLVSKIRERLGRPAGRPVAGDRVMCLTNNRNLGVFNGQQFTVQGAKPGPLGPELELVDDTGAQRRILSHAEGFLGRQAQDNAKAQNLGGRSTRGLFTFANAITCHKAQGSEWGSVYVVNEAPDLLGMTAKRAGMAEATMSARRWLYTAVSRASETVTVAGPRP
jgi:exodeoxyribonuclease-5